MNANGNSGEISVSATSAIIKATVKKRGRATGKLRWILAALLAGCAVLLYFAARFNIDDACKNLLNSFTRQKILQIVSLVDREILLAQVMAQSEPIRAYLADPTNLEKLAVGRAALFHYAQNFVSKKIFWLNNGEQSFHFFNGYRSTEHPIAANQPENDWYNLAIENNSPYSVHVNYNEAIKESCVWVNVPIIKSVSDSRPYALVGCGMNLNDLIFDIYRGHPDEINLLFFNRQNEIVASKNFADIISRRKIADVDDDLSEAIKEHLPRLRSFPTIHNQQNGQSRAVPHFGSENTITFVTKNRVVCIGYVQMLDWFVVSEIARTPLMLSEAQMSKMSLWIFPTILALLIFIGFMIRHVMAINQRLRRTGIAATAASNAKSNFLSMMSHELRTPINAVTGISELIIRESGSPKICKYAETISRAGQNLLALVTNIIDHSRLESKQLEIVPAPYNLREVLEDVIAFTRAKINGKAIMFTADISPSCPDKLVGDLPRVRQILLTILGNAVKHTKKGAVSFYLTAQSQPENRTTTLNVTVSDTGKGIRQENLKDVFIGFGKFNENSVTTGQGAGVELAIAYNLAKAMGGGLDVRSDYGRGSTFTATLPQAVEDFAPLAEMENTAGRNVLLIESRKPYATTVMNAMRDLKIPCRRAVDLVSAAKILRSFAEVEIEDDFEIVEDDSAEKPFSHIFIAAMFFDDALRLLSEIYREQEKFARQFVGGKCLLVRMVTDDSVTALDDDGDIGYQRRTDEQIKLPFASHIVSADLPLWSLPIAGIIACDTEQEIAAQLQSDWFAPDVRILIVDDLEVNLLVLAGMLERHKIQVESCFSGKEALDLVAKTSAAGRPFHLVFTDYMMPNMDGIEVTTKIREIDKNVNVVALTANKAEEIRKAFLSQGACGFLSKPINPATLTQCLLARIPRALIIRQDAL